MKQALLAVVQVWLDRLQQQAVVVSISRSSMDQPANECIDDIFRLD